MGTRPTLTFRNFDGYSFDIVSDVSSRSSWSYVAALMNIGILAMYTHIIGSPASGFKPLNGIFHGGPAHEVGDNPTSDLQRDYVTTVKSLI